MPSLTFFQKTGFKYQAIVKQKPALTEKNVIISSEKRAVEVYYLKTQSSIGNGDFVGNPVFLKFSPINLFSIRKY